MPTTPATAPYRLRTAGSSVWSAFLINSRISSFVMPSFPLGFILLHLDIQCNLDFSPESDTIKRYRRRGFHDYTSGGSLHAPVPGPVSPAAATDSKRRTALWKKLPSKRKLSEQLGISVNTVDSAYCQLEAEGFIQSSPRRGFFVLDAGMLPQAKGPRTGAAIPACRLRAQMDGGLLPLRHGSAAVSLWGLAEAHEELF